MINQPNTLFFQRIILPLYFEELFDSIAPQIAENRTVSNSLLLFLKYSVKCLFLKRLCQAVENLKYESSNQGAKVHNFRDETTKFQE